MRRPTGKRGRRPAPGSTRSAGFNPLSLGPLHFYDPQDAVLSASNVTSIVDTGSAPEDVIQATAARYPVIYPSEPLMGGEDAWGVFPNQNLYDTSWSPGANDYFICFAMRQITSQSNGAYCEGFNAASYFLIRENGVTGNAQCIVGGETVTTTTPMVGVLRVVMFAAHSVNGWEFWIDNISEGTGVGAFVPPALNFHIGARASETAGSNVLFGQFGVYPLANIGATERQQLLDYYQALYATGFASGFDGGFA